MKRKFLPCSLLCMFLAATTAFGNPGDTFYEANLSLTRAARQEKEGDYKAALESGKKAAQLLQSLKISEPEWNPEWVAGKLDAAAQLQRRVEPLVQKAGAPKDPFLRADFLPGRTGMEDSVSEADADTRAGRGGRKWGHPPFSFNC